MKVFVEPVKVFKTQDDAGYKISTDPKVVGIKRYWDEDEGRWLTVLDIEFYCIVDQRVVLENKVRKIEMYVDRDSVEHYNRKQESAFKTINMSNPLEVNNVAFDIVNILESEGVKKFDSHVYLTSFSIHRNFKKFPARYSNIHKLTDSQAFGTRRKFVVTRKRPKRENPRRGTSKTGDKYIDFFRSSTLFKETKIDDGENKAPGARSTFANRYRKLVMQGIDPMSIFQRPDRGQGLSEFLKGNKTIDKCINHNHPIRKLVKDLANADNEFEPSRFGVKKVVYNHRVARLKTKMRMTFKELRTLASQGNNLIVYAIDKDKNKIDSASYQFKMEDMLQDIYQRRPAYKFDVSSSRSRNGFISTLAQNHERQRISLNVYSKKINPLLPMTMNVFELTDGSVPLRPRGRKILTDGSDNNSSLVGSRFGDRYPVFQRFTADFRGEEIANSKSAYVGASRSYNGLPTCSFYPIIVQSSNEELIKINVTNVSTDIMKVRVLKRVVKGNSSRGQDFIRLVDTEGKPQLDKFVDISDHSLTDIFTFIDGDVEDGTKYEYAVELTNRSGYTTRVGTTITEVYEKPSGTVFASVVEAESSGGVDEPTDERMMDGEMTFSPTILIKTQTTDVDKLLNSVFDEKHDLFLNEFKDIKDTSNLIYGVRVHRIDKTIGTIEYVGSFTARKTRSKDSQVEAKEQEQLVKFRDTVTPFHKYVYKIEPFILPPSQVINRVNALIDSTVRRKFNTKGVWGRYQSSANRIRKTSAARKKISSIGSKYASVVSKKGRISANKTFIQNSGADLFSEGFTGDVIYHDLESSLSDYLHRANVITKSRVEKTTFYARSRPGNVKRIRKSVVRIRMEVDGDDKLTDFYIILRRENTQEDMLIDGVVHSTDGPTSGKTYTYMSKCRGSIGAIEYFALPVFKNGELGRFEPLGIYIAEE